MAKKQVVEIQCDRCTRREYLDAGTSKGAGPHTFTFAGTTTVFEDLCSACFKTVEAHVEAIVKKIDGLSPQRVAKQKTGSEEPVPAVAAIPPPPAPAAVPASSAERRSSVGGRSS